MRAGKIMTALNWRHAFGELTLIVLGILIALGISDWNDRRIERIQETALLNEVRTALESDLSELERRLALVRETEPKLEQLSRQLKSGASYEPSMDALFGAAYGVHSINLNTTVYETLKSVGLQSVSNNRLRLGITRIFDHFYERILSERDIDIGATLGVMRPYYLEHFRDLQFLISATPVDYDVLVNDTYFHNILDYRLAILRSNQLQSYPEVIAEINAVLELLVEELP